MRVIRIHTCGNPIEAELVKGRLKNEGIESFLSNENFTGLMPVFDVLGAGVHIFVDETDVERARLILKEELEPDSSKITCPHCGSGDIGLGLGRRKGLKIFDIILSLFVSVPFGNVKPKYYCRKCRKEIR